MAQVQATPGFQTEPSETEVNAALADVFVAGAAFAVATLITMIQEEHVTTEELSEPLMVLALVTKTLVQAAHDAEATLAADTAAHAAETSAEMPA